jgi:hypothetical protein
MPRKIVEELVELRERQEEFEDDTFEILSGEYQKVVDDLARDLEKSADRLETDGRGNFKGETKIVVDARKAEAKAEAALTALWTRWQDRLARLAKQQVDYTAKAQGERRPRSLPKQEQEVAEALLGLWPKGDQPGSGVAGQFYNLGAKHRRDLADAVTRHVLGRAPKAKLVKEIAEKTERSKAQAEQLIRDSTMQFSRTIKANNSDRYEFFEYRGPSDAVTRDFCRRHVDRVYTREEIDAMDNGQTGAGTVFIAGGGYNCRHAWFPVLPEWFDEDEWEELRSGVGGGTGEDPDRAYGEGNWEETDDIPVQEFTQSCGAACAKKLLNRPDLSDEELGGSDRFGIAAPDLARTLNRYKPGHVGGTFDPLYELKPTAGVKLLTEYFELPFIAAQGRHWVVVEKIEGSRVFLLDPWGVGGPGSPAGVRADITIGKFHLGLFNGEYNVIGKRKNGG